MVKLIDDIEALATAQQPMRVTDHDGWMALRKSVEGATQPVELDREEDQVDAVLCAYIGMFFARRREETTIFGDFPGPWLHRHADDSARLEGRLQ
jgi:predicted RNase H-like nuclease